MFILCFFPRAEDFFFDIEFQQFPSLRLVRRTGLKNILIEILPLFFSPRRGEFYYAFPTGKDRMGQKTNIIILLSYHACGIP
jgi:hypothetical protein